MVYDKTVRKAILMDVAVSKNNNMLDNYQEKISKYKNLAFETKEM